MRVSDVIDAQRGALFPWSPVFLAAGIGTYFAIRFEPDRTDWAVAAVLAAVTLLALIRFREQAPLFAALLLFLAGLAIAAYRTHAVAAPVLSFRYYGPIEGRVVAIDRSASDKDRITLDRVVLSRVDPDRTPARVRVSLHGQQGFVALEPGLRVILTGHLSPPGGPVEPGGFDFRRQAWFQKLGAVGYTRTPVLAAAPAAEGSAGLWVHRLRARLSAAVQAALPGRPGAFAAAITTGDRSAMDEGTLESLRISNLAHLLAISGLHMGLLTGFVYALLRGILALVPVVALRWPIHKLAAIAALGAGAFYLALSGGNVATERAFIMVAVMFAAILVDRRALTLRSVALAALVVLALRPEVLTGPGFQMSFAATAALIAVFAAIRDTTLWARGPFTRWAVALVVSSAVAGLATAPFAAAHFNRLPHYGLVANIFAVPVMGAIVMPGAVIAAILAPIGLAGIGLTMMSGGTRWILAVADRVAALDGAVSHVISPPPAVLPMMALGGLFLILWQGRARWLGVLPAAAALLLWSAADRPLVLVAEDAGLVGLMTADGRALSKPRGSGFAAETWLENDGDATTQADAFTRVGFTGEEGDTTARVGGAHMRHLWGRGATDRIAEACKSAALVVVAVDRAEAPGPCRLVDRESLRASGSLAVWPTDDGLRIVTSAERTGVRPWNPPP